MTDQQLWNQLKRGSKEALEKIYRFHIDSLLQYGQKVTKDKALIEDCIHDLFISIWQHRTTVGETDSIQRYLLVALRRNIVKKLQAKQKISSDWNENLPFEADLAIDEKIIGDETAKESSIKLREAFNHLSKRQKEAIYLKYYHHLSYDDICNVMLINYQSARNLIFSGIQSLRKYLTLIILSIYIFK